MGDPPCFPQSPQSERAGRVWVRKARRMETGKLLRPSGSYAPWQSSWSGRVERGEGHRHPMGNGLKISPCGGFPPLSQPSSTSSHGHHSWNSTLVLNACLQLLPLWVSPAQVTCLGLGFPWQSPLRARVLTLAQRDKHWQCHGNMRKFRFLLSLI